MARLDARFKDLTLLKVNPYRRPVLDSAPSGGFTSADAALFEYEGSRYTYHVMGNQATQGTIRVAMYPGSMEGMSEGCFPTGMPALKMDTKKREYACPQ